jgi:hypothetical protein
MNCALSIIHLLSEPPQLLPNTLPTINTTHPVQMEHQKVKWTDEEIFVDATGTGGVGTGRLGRG